MILALFSGCSRPSASSGGNDNPSANNTGSTSSEEPIVIKIGHTDSDTRSTHKWSVWLGEWLEEQALADGCFGLALGLPLHLGLPPFVTGSKLVTKVLTEDMKQLTGGQVIINGDAKESADILEKIIMEKRAGLNI